MATKRPKRDLSDDEIVRRAQALRELCIKTAMEEGGTFLISFPSPLVRYYDTDNPPPPDPPGTHRVSLKFLTDDERDAELEAYDHETIQTQHI